MKQQANLKLAIKKKWVKRVVWALITIFLLLNFVPIFHSYKFTHYTERSVEKTKDPGQLTTMQKLGTLIFGVSNSRQVNDKHPLIDFETIELESNKRIECWRIKTDSAKGTVILFHGFGGHKSSMLDKADVFRELGYSVLLVDFMGAGGSEGNQTTIGYFEAEQVKTCFDYLTQQGEQNIFLFGTSMGAVAIMKAINDHKLSPKGIIIECPFGSLYETVCARFKTMNVPAFPMAGLLVFWGGIQNGFWGFEHNPTEYARQINCPVLLMYGAQDAKVNRTEIDEIFENLCGPKQLKIYQDAGHENYLTKYKHEWTRNCRTFMDQE